MSKYTDVQIEKMVKKYKESGVGKTIFAKQEKIGINTLNKWLSEITLDEKENTEVQTPKFMKVTKTLERKEMLASKKSEVVKIHFKDFKITVEEAASEELLSMVLKVVKELC